MVFGVLHAAPDVKTLREQLALATEDENTLSRIELLRRILDAEPGDTASHRELISLWLSIRDYDMAQAALDAWPDAPADVAALTRAEVLRRRDDDLAGAIRVLEEYLAKSPQDMTAREALIDCLLAAKDNTTLLAALDSALASSPSTLNLIRRADVKAALGDFKGALADAAAAQKAEPDADIVKNAIPRFERLQETLDALSALDEAIAADPKNVQALLDRAWWWRYGGVNERALADAEAAATVAPTSLAAQLARYRSLFLLDRVKAWEVRDETKLDVVKTLSLPTSQAILAADLALAKNPDDIVQLAKRAYALNEAEQFLLAREDIDRALALDPKASDAALEGVYALAAQNGDPSVYLRKLEQAAPTPHQLALAYGYMADMYFRASNLALALDFANRSLEAEESERVLRVKAAALQRMDRGNEAVAILKRADALQKKNP
jgi:hypothetical protein